jgi:hypothetical protein
VPPPAQAELMVIGIRERSSATDRDEARVTRRRKNHDLSVRQRKERAANRPGWACLLFFGWLYGYMSVRGGPRRTWPSGVVMATYWPGSILTVHPGL